MRLATVRTNLRQNSQPFLVILVFVVILVSFLRRDVVADSKPKPRMTQGTKLKIGLYKNGTSGQSTLGRLHDALDAAFRGSGFEVEFSYPSNIDTVVKQLENGTVHVAGELSPIEYIANYRISKFSPLVGLEYDGRAFYRSVLFVPDEATVGGMHFSGSPGIDNLEIILDLVGRENTKFSVGHLQSRGSTSGFYYPCSYLLNEGVSKAAMLPLLDDDKLFKEVLEARNNGCIAGFMADFRLESRERQRVAGDPKFSKCAKPLIVDTSDPIPNGVFVISDRARLDPALALDVKKLIRLWKTAKNVSLGESKFTLGATNGNLEVPDNTSAGESVSAASPIDSSRITGWRSGNSLQRELELAEYHKNFVDYAKFRGTGYKRLWTIVIVILIIVLAIASFTVISIREA